MARKTSATDGHGVHGYKEIQRGCVMFVAMASGHVRHRGACRLRTGEPRCGRSSSRRPGPRRAHRGGTGSARMRARRARRARQKKGITLVDNRADANLLIEVLSREQREERAAGSGASRSHEWVTRSSASTSSPATRVRPQVWGRARGAAPRRTPRTASSSGSRGGAATEKLGSFSLRLQFAVCSLQLAGTGLAGFAPL